MTEPAFIFIQTIPIQESEKNTAEQSWLGYRVQTVLISLRSQSLKSSNDSISRLIDRHEYYRPIDCIEQEHPPVCLRQINLILCTIKFVSINPHFLEILTDHGIYWNELDGNNLFFQIWTNVIPYLVHCKSLWYWCYSRIDRRQHRISLPVPMWLVMYGISLPQWHWFQMIMWTQCQHTWNWMWRS